MSFLSVYIIYSLCGSGIYDRLTAITPLAHHGMIFVPFGIRFAYSNEFGNVKEVKGGSPYCTGTYVGRGANSLRVDACIRPWLLLWQHHKAAQGSYCNVERMYLLKTANDCIYSNRKYFVLRFVFLFMVLYWLLIFVPFLYITLL